MKQNVLWDTRAERGAVYVAPEFFQYINPKQGAWYETEEEVAKGLAWGERKRVLLERLRQTMEARLTACECGYVEKYYFEGMNYCQIAEHFGVARSSANRGVNRALRKLRLAMQEAEDGPGTPEETAAGEGDERTAPEGPLPTDPARNARPVRRRPVR